MRTDESIKWEVMAALETEKGIDPGSIAVAVEDGVVTLSGHVRTYSEKARAEDVAHRVQGVRAVAQELEVRLITEHERNDTDIAAAVANALAWNVWVPSENIKIQVEHGLVRLEGHVRSTFERQMAEEAIRDLMGVRGVVNLLQTPPKASASAIHEGIEKALHDTVARDVRRITIESRDGTVTLNGTVRSWTEREEAESAAYRQKGVSKVLNYLNVGY